MKKRIYEELNSLLFLDHNMVASAEDEETQRNIRLFNSNRDNLDRMNFNMEREIASGDLSELIQFSISSQEWSGLESVLSKRSSKPENCNSRVSKQDLFGILHYGYGLKSGESERRYSPAAGAIYNLIFRVIVFDVVGLKSGIYRYFPRASGLKFEKEIPDFVMWHFSAFSDSSINAVIHVSAALENKVTKYSKLGYRHCLMDAGHALQNAWLAAAHKNIQCRLQSLFPARISQAIGDFNPKAEIFMNSLILNGKK